MGERGMKDLDDNMVTNGLKRRAAFLAEVEQAKNRSLCHWEDFPMCILTLPDDSCTYEAEDVDCPECQKSLKIILRRRSQCA